MFNSQLQLNADTVVPRQSGYPGGPENSRAPCPSQIILVHYYYFIIIISTLLRGVFLLSEVSLQHPVMIFRMSPAPSRFPSVVLIRG